MVLYFFHQAEFFQLFNGFSASRLSVHSRERRIFIKGCIFIQDVYQRQVMTFADLKIVKVMRRRNLNGTGTFFRVGMFVADNGNRTVNNRQNGIVANQLV